MECWNQTKEGKNLLLNYLVQGDIGLLLSAEYAGIKVTCEPPQQTYPLPK